MIPDDDRILVYMNLSAREARSFLVWLNRFHDADYEPKERRADAGPMGLRNYVDRTLRVSASMYSNTAVEQVRRALSSSLDIDAIQLNTDGGAQVLWNAPAYASLVRSWLRSTLHHFGLLTDQHQPSLPDDDVWLRAVRFYARNGITLERCEEVMWHMHHWGRVYHHVHLLQLALELCYGAGGVSEETLAQLERDDGSAGPEGSGLHAPDDEDDDTESS